ncbi:Piso0_003394 [Millerozyma farinosa CBS 7064]|uniref:Piso0_003394 protein n=1 Tax=Pichia sorbitophila (strain ATCC MYA-4447 / BCRC 22081 / CBS 7064 / NBRC 10061 / NRRL Y-12695) TaxID=559304 RepID=G8YHZ4_PICSO|nr:Piso0_003394 [Millerozyma farinosa CBS 7064]CCE81046.1 Piso0_003394 [Millerozyma farinosa CBS 7064]
MSTELRHTVVSPPQPMSFRPTGGWAQPYLGATPLVTAASIERQRPFAAPKIISKTQSKTQTQQSRASANTLTRAPVEHARQWHPSHPLTRPLRDSCCAYAIAGAEKFQKARK